ncbi:TIGR04282 family arsenosugar biosynthesis glycosyltransferase [Spongiimicrobium salis]|uniref:TIGR04282 family arsenosugar biosynthesis glycosyltransferase n=1 Tax=Spongiimicrobium salis TaxID=1667022 RepID=UPI00374CF52B
MKEKKQNLLLIFTRNPELGKCKTRLAAVTGNEIALDIYVFLLEHTKKITKNLKASKQVFYSESIWEDDIWDNTFYDKKLQLGADLGERMDNAFKAGFQDHFEKIVVIGSDMYDLTEADIADAFDQLNDHDYVIGPAEDGGYYLLGCTTYTPELFKNKEWGTETVFQDTYNTLANKNTKVLEPKNDVDTYQDIAHIEAFQPFLKTVKHDA